MQRSASALCLGLSILFAAAGISKLADLDGAFAKVWPEMGIPLAFITVVGVLEIIAAVGLMIRRFAAGVAAALATFMLIALALTAQHQIWGGAIPAVVTFTLCATACRLRWPDFHPFPTRGNPAKG